MGFLKRLSSTLFSPKDVIQYRTDSLWVTVLYFLFLLLFSILPVSISIIRSEGLDYETRRDIISHFSGNEDIPFEIIDGKLVHDEVNPLFVYSEQINSDLRIIFTLDKEIQTDITSTIINIFLREDGLYVSQSAFIVKIFSYDEYPELNNIDFSDLSNRTSPTWDIVFSVISQEVAKLKPTMNIVQIGFLAASGLITMIFISLILAFFQSFNLTGVLSFGKIWKMCIYVLTPYVVGNVLGLLFGSPLLFYLGLGMTAIYAASISQNILKESSRKDKNNDL